MASVIWKRGAELDLPPQTLCVFIITRRSYFGFPAVLRVHVY